MKCSRCSHENPEDTRFCGRCGRELTGSGDSASSGTMTVQATARGLERGTTFARRFEIIEEIGKGGMGTVYKAYDSKVREVVAIKLLKPEIASDLEVIERFRNEIKLARKVAHRHVCRMYDLDEEWLSIYISMEYVPGEDLKSFIRRSGHLNEAKALALARQIAEGLAEAHRMGVVHRDLKPQNVMIDREGNAKIMDFGIARSLHTRGATGSGVIIGTPEYMAPEQADAKDVDHRVDIYALGAILFEMVTGRLPFEGETPLSIVLKHKSEPPADPKTLNAQISPALSGVILRCLEKSRDRRYQTALDLLEDLGRIEKGLPTTQRALPARKPITTREITVKFNLKKLLVPGLIVAALAVAGLIAVLQKPAGKGPQAEVATKSAAVTPYPDRRAVPPPPRGVEGLASVFLKGGESSKIISSLAPFLRDPLRQLTEEDVQELEKVLVTIREDHPAEAAAFSGFLDSIEQRIREGKKLGEAGDVEASRRSFGRGESEMRKLLAQVSERDKAEASFKNMEAAKQKIVGAGRGDRPNLLTWIAGEKEKDAADAFGKNDFSGARILYSILERVYLLSLRVEGEDQGLGALQGLVGSLRQEAVAAQAPSKEAWLFNRAVEDETGAVELAREKNYMRAAERFILAAFLFEKAKEVALESAGAGRE
ncbi:MAG: serine/threonine-protein kinase [Candidatus Aminicenantes bacterium]